MKTLKDLATEMLLSDVATVDFQNHGWQLRKDKGLSDLIMATKKARQMPPFKIEYHGEENGGFEYYEKASCDECQALYTSPQALAPITADDVTDEMVDAYLTSDVADWRDFTPALQLAARQVVARIVTAYLSIRSEAK